MLFEVPRHQCGRGRHLSTAPSPVIHLRMLHLQLPADYKAKHGLSFLMTKQVKSRCAVCDAEFLFTNTKAGVV